MTRDLSEAAVAERLEAMGRLYVPMTLAEALAEEVQPQPVDMSSAAITARLEELSALWRLSLWLVNAASDEDRRGHPQGG